MKKLRLLSTFAAVFLTSLNSFGYKMCFASITLKTGDTLSGYIKVPFGNANVNLELFTSENSETFKKIESNAIRLLKLKHNGKTAELIFAARTTLKGKVLDFFSWWTIVAKTPQLIVAISYGSLNLDKYGEFVGKFENYTADNDIHVILKTEELQKSDKIVGTFLTMMSDNRVVLGGNGILRKASKRYFNDCPALIEKIDNKGFDNKIEDIQKMLNFYGENCLK